MKITNKIQELLEQKRYLRDCDKKLTTHLWYRELINKGLDPHSLPITDFLRLYAEGKVTTDATISRLRSKIQETNAPLRGQRYLERQAKQNKVQKDLGYNV
jgi:hypothetical protein